jgi:hypothetical protein
MFVFAKHLTLRFFFQHTTFNHALAEVAPLHLAVPLFSSILLQVLITLRVISLGERLKKNGLTMLNLQRSQHDLL